MFKKIIAGSAICATVANCFDTLDVKQKSGLIKEGTQDDMFYWLFYSARDATKDPLVLWLTGGPGCASELAVFMENGPYKIDK